MRKHQQQQILDLMATLYEATNEIYRQFSTGAVSNVINLLGDCQDAAVHIGEFIESLEGEETRTVQLLTRYHESLYNIAIRIESADVSFVKQLKKELSAIEASVRKELKPNKIEVAFFPYKASMWDALESIWLAAKEDPQCDAYVVPIPYFDKLPSGGLGQMHYEGDQYPDDVPIVDWQTYNLEERRPDVSFIHNGYDEYNMVTTVHPNYYSRNLKQYTELLCYSPYFVAANEVEAHFCTMQGIVYSDRVFVQSEKVRDGYIRAIQAFEKEHNCPGRFGKVKEKIVASGSPKFDKVINSKPEDFTLPDEWKKLTERPDGSQKKVILYNTSIGPILTGNEKYIEKLRSVFDTFRNRDDVVLWWRPHPLSQATYDSMRPQLFKEYKQLIQAYRHEGFGIYDDTADLHRALSLSSAFYGDGTSLMQMYQCMRKPVLVQNEELRDDSLLIGSICDTGEHLWFLTLNINGLFRLNKKTWNADYIASFANEKAFDWRVYHTIHRSGSKLYFSPHSAGSIAIYDTLNSSFQYVELPSPKEKKYNDQSKFSRIIECEGSLFFIPLHFPGIIKLNMHDDSIEIIDEWVKPAQKMIFDSERGYFSNGVYDAERNSLILAFSNVNAVLSIDLSNNRTVFNEIGTEKSGYSDILLMDGTYWLIALHKAALINFNLANQTIKEYSINLEGITADGFGQFQKLVFFDNYLYIVPAEASRIVKFNLSNLLFSDVDSFYPANMQEHASLQNINSGYFFMSSNISDKIYVTEKQSDQLIEYDPRSGLLRHKNVIVNTGRIEFQKFLMKRQGLEFNYANSCAFGEHSYMASLENLLDIIEQPIPVPWFERLLDKQVNLRLSEIAHSDGKAGIAIYEKSKRSVLK